MEALYWHSMRAEYLYAGYKVKTRRTILLFKTFILFSAWTFLVMDLTKVL